MEHKTGLEEMYVMKDHRRLRCGFTTGSCAAAASKAAACMLFTGKPVETVDLMTPKGILLHLPVEDIAIKKASDGAISEVSCAVRKDGGDDPDATNGLLIYSRVKKSPEKEICIDGGVGVGRVTKPGLNQPVGNAAINSTPRKMIREGVREICTAFGYQGGIDVLISIPEGEETAKKTFNPRLGIVGGISVLGTSGIVMPMSEEALIRSIGVEMSMLHRNGGEYLVITPGNYGETFSHNMQGLDLTYEMKCSNFVGETIDLAEELGVKGILFIAHIGKFIKVSGGIMNTHSRNADSRAELMAAAALRSGASLDTVGQILNTNTTEEALDVLSDCGGDLLENTMKQVAQRVHFYLNNRCRGKLEIGAILFSSVKGYLAETDNARQLVEAINGQVADLKNRS
ncbi:MAG: cobalt-precorrin-5B (C(1))-methyltransferase CbiD [Lachnospiraceae bacterium]|nr:cobalt-precorrin-5B (C(1))-methyltransferase CbiD [Lachnospiraceae bacterium]